MSPVLWTAVEKFWPEMFPNYLGASQYKLSLLTQIADVTGILGVSFLVVYINSTLYLLLEEWIKNRRFAWRQAAAFMVVVTVAPPLWGGIRIRDVDRQAARAEKLTVGLIQANHGAGEKYGNPGAVLRDHREMSETLAGNRPLDLIVWPEGIGTISLTSRTGRLSSDLLGNPHTPLLFGMILNDWQGNERRVYNTAILTDSGGNSRNVRQDGARPLRRHLSLAVLYSWSPYSSRFWPGKAKSRSFSASTRSP